MKAHLEQVEKGGKHLLKWARNKLGALESVRHDLGLPALVKQFKIGKSHLWIKASEYGNIIRVTGGLGGYVFVDGVNDTGFTAFDIANDPALLAAFAADFGTTVATIIQSAINLGITLEARLEQLIPGPVGSHWIDQLEGFVNERMTVFTKANPGVITTGKFGNVDWRGGSRVLSYWGPSGRYWGQVLNPGSGSTSRVFEKLVATNTPSQVWGCAIYKKNGRIVYVSTTQPPVVRIRVPDEDVVIPVGEGGEAINWTVVPLTLTGYPSPGNFLTTPWFFNSLGTEAQQVIRDFDGLPAFIDKARRAKLTITEDANGVMSAAIVMMPDVRGTGTFAETVNTGYHGPGQSWTGAATLNMHHTYKSIVVADYVGTSEALITVEQQVDIDETWSGGFVENDNPFGQNAASYFGSVTFTNTVGGVQTMQVAYPDSTQLTGNASTTVDILGMGGSNLVSSGSVSVLNALVFGGGLEPGGTGWIQQFPTPVSSVSGADHHPYRGILPVPWFVYADARHSMMMMDTMRVTGSGMSIGESIWDFAHGAFVLVNGTFTKKAERKVHVPGGEITLIEQVSTVSVLPLNQTLPGSFAGVTVGLSGFSFGFGASGGIGGGFFRTAPPIRGDLGNTVTSFSHSGEILNGMIPGRWGWTSGFVGVFVNGVAARSPNSCIGSVNTTEVANLVDLGGVGFDPESEEFTTAPLVPERVTWTTRFLLDEGGNHLLDAEDNHRFVTLLEVTQLTGDTLAPMGVL